MRALLAAGVLCAAPLTGCGGAPACNDRFVQIGAGTYAGGALRLRVERVDAGAVGEEVRVQELGTDGGVAREYRATYASQVRLGQ